MCVIDVYCEGRAWVSSHSRLHGQSLQGCALEPLPDGLTASSENTAYQAIVCRVYLSWTNVLGL